VSDLRGWLAGRTPAPPDALPLPVPDGEGDPVALLADAGALTLERAIAGEGERAGAYDLLSADALLTYACERAAAAPDPEAELLRILARMARKGG
jgi:hypothetical protein